MFSLLVSNQFLNVKLIKMSENITHLLDLINQKQDEEYNLKAVKSFSKTLPF
jgi:hypothetical protein